MTEKFTLEKAGRNRGAVYLDEASLFSWTQFVNRPGHQLFSGSGFAQNENRRTGWRNNVHAPQDGLKRQSLPNHVPNVVVQPDLVLEVKLLRSEPLLHLGQLPVSKRILDGDGDLARDLRQEFDVFRSPDIIRHSRERQRSDRAVSRD